MTEQKHHGEDDLTMACQAEDVVAFLQAHPQFFEEHQALLTDLTLFHPISGDAISLIERQVALIREDNAQLRDRIQELINIARVNDSLISRLHQLSLALIQSVSLDECLDILAEKLQQDFVADLVSIRLFDSCVAHEISRTEFVGDEAQAKKHFSAILATGKPVCGHFSEQQLTYLFEDRSANVKSTAVIPLMDNRHALGLFAVASRDVGRFRAGMSTQFLSYLGEMSAVIVKRFL